MLIFFEVIHLYISLGILAIVLIVLWFRRKSLSCLFFCAMFGIYLIGVVGVVIFPIHIPEERIELQRNLQFNLIPFNMGRCDFLPVCLGDRYHNILLTIPFGFGISFIKPLKPKKILWLALLVGLVFEATQLLLSLVVGSPFRVVDINDVLMNAAGILLGYGIFRIFGWLYVYITKRFEINNKYVFAFIYDVFRQSTAY